MGRGKGGFVLEGWVVRATERKVVLLGIFLSVLIGCRISHALCIGMNTTIQATIGTPTWKARALAVRLLK